MENRIRLVLTVLAVGFFLLLAGTSVLSGDSADACGDLGAMPELTAVEADAWIGSEPLTRADLAGRVVLLNVWTFG